MQYCKSMGGYSIIGYNVLQGNVVPITGYNVLQANVVPITGYNVLQGNGRQWEATHANHRINER